MCNDHDCLCFDGDVHEEVATLRARVAELEALLGDWLLFADDIQPGCAAGKDWLDSLRARTQIALAAVEAEQTCVWTRSETRYQPSCASDKGDDSPNRWAINFVCGLGFVYCPDCGKRIEVRT